MIRKYNPRTGRYERTDRFSDNAGELSIDTNGELSIGIGGGLGIDTDGDLTLKIAPGISIDLGGSDSGSDPFGI